MRKPFIVIVDGDPSVRKSLERLLKAAGFETMTFACARGFLERGDLAQTPECLVIDTHLDGMNGFELYEYLVAAGSAIPIIFMTAHDDALTRERARKIGVCLRKPFEQHALLGAIYRALKQEEDSLIA